MLAAGFVDLFVRMLTSLAVVLAIVAVAYFVMRRRSGMVVTARAAGMGRRAGAQQTGAVKAAGAAASPRAGWRGPKRTHRQAVEVIGRVGLSRSTVAVAVRFGDRVLLLGASEQGQPNVLADIDAATWELCEAEAAMAQTEWTVPAALGDGDGADATDRAMSRPGFLDALREATVRRA